MSTWCPSAHPAATATSKLGSARPVGWTSQSVQQETMTSTIDSPSTVQRRTRVRMVVVVLCILLGMVTYIDRACISTLAPSIRLDLGLSEHEMGWVFTVFAIAYGTMGIPSAWWADRIGTRNMLTAVVIAWSIFTIGTGTALGLISLLVIRFCFGVGEAGAWPAVTRTLSRWIPYRERRDCPGHRLDRRTRFRQHRQCSSRCSARRSHMPWRWIFVVFGLVGLVWAAVWYHCVRDEPAEHAGVNKAELQYIMSGRKSAAEEERPRGWSFWRRLLTNRNVVALCLMYMPNSAIFYFCLTWLPIYLSDGRGMGGQTLAFFTGLPLMLSVAADVLGGPATDLAVRFFGPRYGRAGVGFVSYVLAALGMFLAAVSGSAVGAATFFALGTPPTCSSSDRRGAPARTLAAGTPEW